MISCQPKMDDEEVFGPGRTLFYRYRYGQIDGQIDRQIDGWIYRYKDRYIDGQINEQIDRQMYRERTWIDRQIDR